MSAEGKVASPAKQDRAENEGSLSKLFRGNVLFSLMFVVIFAVLTYTAMGYNPLARSFPLIVSIPGLLISLLQFVRDVTGALRGEPEEKKKDKEKMPARVAATLAAGAGTSAVGAAETLAAAAKVTGAAAIAEPEKKKKPKLSPAEKRNKEFIGIGWIVAYVIGIYVIGFPLATIAYMLGFIMLYNKESWKLSIAYTAVLMVFIWIAFVFFLKSNLYAGMIYDMLVK